MILAQSTTDDIRRLHDIWVARLAFEYRCERDDVLAAIKIDNMAKSPSSTPSRPIPQAPAARTYPPAPVDVQAEAAPQSPPTPSPETAPPSRQAETLQGEGGTALSENTVHHSEPQPETAVQAQAVEPSSEELDDPSHSLPGAERAVDRAPSTPPRGRSESTRAKVVAVHKANPSWPSKLIAQHLGISEDSVRATASRKKLKLVSWWDYERAQAAAKAAELRAAVQPQPKPAEVVEPVAETDAPVEGSALTAVTKAARKPKPSVLDLLRECNEANPTWTAQQVADHLGLSWRKVDGLAALHQIPIVPAPAPSVTLAGKIRAYLVDHPEATLKEVSDAIGARMQSVSWAALKAGIELRKRTTQEISDAAVIAAGKRQQAAVVEPQPIKPPADNPAHVMRKAPQGRFYLRDEAGLFVHQSLNPSPTGIGPLMTKDRKWGWYDTMERYRGAKAKWPQLAFMRKEAALV